MSKLERRVLQEMAANLLSIYDAQMIGLWLTTKNMTLDGRSPLEAMKDGDGDKVLTVLDQLATGAYV